MLNKGDFLGKIQNCILPLSRRLQLLKRKPAIGGEKKRKLAAIALGNISDILLTFEKLEVAPFPSSAGATANFISLQASLLISSQTLRLVAAQSISGASRNSVNVQLKACPQGWKKFGGLQGDFNCGTSSKADFILNYFHSNSSIFLNFPQFSSQILHFLPPRLAGLNKSHPGDISESF